MKIPRFAVLTVATLALASVAACAPADDSDDTKDDTAAASCKTADLSVVTPGKLTIATDDPAYEPWFSDNTPSNGKGFEGAVAAEIADELGFDAADVVWVKVPFNTSYQPGKKNFDFDINQISITAERQKAVDFSTPYYEAAQAIITLKDSDYADASSLADFKDAKLGAQIGTTSLKAIKDQIKPAEKALVYDDTTKAAAALQNKQVDGIVADLPTAFYLTAAEIDGSVIAGQFQFSAGEPEKFGLLLAKGSKLTPCVNQAIASLEKDGTLADLAQEWLAESASAPVLK